MRLANDVLGAASRGSFITPVPVIGPGSHAGKQIGKPRQYRWGDDADHTLLSMRTLGLNWYTIGEAMGRSHEACRQRFIRLTMAPEEQERRNQHKRRKRHVTGI